MPRGDGTGPNGMGSMTGRGLGYCAGYSTPGFTKGFGMGLGRGGGGIRMGRAWGGPGRGMGRGRGYWGYGRPAYYAPVQAAPVYNPVAPGYAGPVDKDTELKYLKDEKQYLESSLNDLAKRIEELEKQE